MKYRTLFFLLACSAALAQTEWLTMLGDPRNPLVDTIQVDPTPLASSGTQKTMGVRMSRSGQQTSRDGVTYRSFESRVLFDCQRKTARYLEVRYYAAPAWRGDVLRKVAYPDDPPRWMQFRGIQPNPNERIVQAVCGGSRVDNVSAAGAGTEPRHAVSGAQIQRLLEQRFPLKYPVRGVVDVELEVPRLRFMPQQNRLGAELAVTAAGPSLRRPHTGLIDLDFALRYEPSDLSVRAHQIRVNSAHVDGLTADASRLLDAYARVAAEQSLREVVLHRFTPQELTLPATMGLEPGTITVTPDGLVIGFVPKSQR